MMTTEVTVISTKATNITEIEKKLKSPDFSGLLTYIKIWISWDSGMC